MTRPTDETGDNVTEGREYRAIAETALSTASPDELRQLVRKLATIADQQQAKIFDRNAAARQLLEWGKNHDQARRGYFVAIDTTKRILARALGLSIIADFEQREELFKLALSGLEKQVEIGCPQVEWPEESAFPVRKAS